MMPRLSSAGRDNVIKSLLDVELNNPVILPAALARDGNGIMG